MKTIFILILFILSSQIFAGGMPDQVIGIKDYDKLKKTNYELILKNKALEQLIKDEQKYSASLHKLWLIESLKTSKKTSNPKKPVKQLKEKVPFVFEIIIFALGFALGAANI